MSFLTGIFVSASVLYLVSKLFAKNRIKQLQKVQVFCPDNIPEKLKKYIEQTVSEDHKPETSEWLNLMVARYFLEFRRFSILEEEYINWINETLNASVEGALFSKLDVTDIEFGNSAPRIESVRIIKCGPQKDLAVETEMEIVWDGNATISLDLQIFGGTVYPSLVRLTHLRSKVNLRVPSKMSAYKVDVIFGRFEGEDLAEFTIDINKKGDNIIEENLSKVLSKLLQKTAHDFTTGVFTFDIPVISTVKMDESVPEVRHPPLQRVPSTKDKVKEKLKSAFACFSISIRNLYKYLSRLKQQTALRQLMPAPKELEAKKKSATASRCKVVEKVKNPITFSLNLSFPPKFVAEFRIDATIKIETEKFINMIHSKDIVI
ncbi:hypothetical protein HK099_000744 [Clydaea vesicula]|uniref:SMP-LTD domain-containing protein n=1 Tax=Clydaea vesicula TaxID=447962 RepID=A0AAD5U7K9_9FUNG|nr:hypothetical protein HK099_000744 [Clydaea vesicula]